jgi:hypothetical protein
MGKLKFSLEMGKKLFPNASKKIQKLVQDEYDSAKIHMSANSAASYAKASIRDKYKTDFSGIPKVDKKNLGGLSGGVSSGPPPKKGPNSNGIQIKGFKFSGIK